MGRGDNPKSWTLNLATLLTGFRSFVFMWVFEMITKWQKCFTKGTTRHLILILRPSQGFWRTGEQWHIFQGNKGLK